MGVKYLFWKIFKLVDREDKQLDISNENNIGRQINLNNKEKRKLIVLIPKLKLL